MLPLQPLQVQLRPLVQRHARRRHRRRHQRRRGPCHRHAGKHTNTTTNTATTGAAPVLAGPSSHLRAVLRGAWGVRRDLHHAQQLLHALRLDLVGRGQVVLQAGQPLALVLAQGALQRARRHGTGAPSRRLRPRPRRRGRGSTALTLAEGGLGWRGAGKAVLGDGGSCLAFCGDSAKQGCVKPLAIMREEDEEERGEEEAEKK